MSPTTIRRKALTPAAYWETFRAPDVSPAETLAEVEFLIEHLKVKTDAHLLDVACGTGRHATALAQRGYSVTGIDINAEYIAHAKQVNKDSQERLNWLNDDMRNINWKAEFDGGFCLGDSFGYFDHGASETFIAALAKALKQGSRIIIDTSSVAEVLIPNLQKEQVIQFDDSVVNIKNTYHAESSCLESIYELTTDSLKESNTSLRWIFTAGEINRMLGKAGLLVAGLYGSLEGTHFELGADRLLILAQKR